MKILGIATIIAGILIYFFSSADLVSQRWIPWALGVTVGLVGVAILVSCFVKQDKNN